MSKTREQMVYEIKRKLSKGAFVPNPANSMGQMMTPDAQAAMGGGMPPGFDPSMLGGAPPQGMPPGMDPSMMGGGGMPQGGMPPMDPALMQMMLAQMGGGTPPAPAPDASAPPTGDSSGGNEPKGDIAEIRQRLGRLEDNTASVKEMLNKLMDILGLNGNGPLSQAGGGQQLPPGQGQGQGQGQPGQEKQSRRKQDNFITQVLQRLQK